MGHSQAEKAESRERILSITAQKIRESGFDSISVAEIMKLANLTHGGFYGHFKSKDELIAAALERAMRDGEALSAVKTKTKGRGTVKMMLNSYLSPAHRDEMGSGCALSALAGDIARSDEGVKAVVANQLERYFGSMSEAIGDVEGADQFAVSAWSTMIGAVMLSRIFSSDPRSDQILAQARASILELAALYQSQPDK